MKRRQPRPDSEKLRSAAWSLALGPFIFPVLLLPLFGDFRLVGENIAIYAAVFGLPGTAALVLW